MQKSQRIEKFLTMIEKSDCWTWLGCKNSDGYGNFRFDGKVQKAHRIAYTIFKGDAGALNVLHTCDNPACVKPDHLMLGTQKENCLDMVKKGRHVGNRTLTRTQVEEIRAHPNQPYSGLTAVLAAKYAVTQQQIRAIRRGVRW